MTGSTENSWERAALPGMGPTELDLSERSAEKVSYHVMRLADAGLIDAVDVSSPRCSRWCRSSLEKVRGLQAEFPASKDLKFRPHPKSVPPERREQCTSRTA